MLNDQENPVDISRARATAEVAQVIINSVKTEIDYAKATGNNILSDFIPEPEAKAIADSKIKELVNKSKNTQSQTIKTESGYVRITGR
jgi:hypothetical protein